MALLDSNQNLESHMMHKGIHTHHSSIQLPNAIGIIDTNFLPAVQHVDGKGIYIRGD